MDSVLVKVGFSRFNRVSDCWAVPSRCRPRLGWKVDRPSWGSGGGTQAAEQA